MKDKLEIPLAIAENHMAALVNSPTPMPEGNGVLKFLLESIAELYLTPEQQQRVKTVIELHYQNAYRVVS